MWRHRRLPASASLLLSLGPLACLAAQPAAERAEGPGAPPVRVVLTFAPLPSTGLGVDVGPATALQSDSISVTSFTAKSIEIGSRPLDDLLGLYARYPDSPALGWLRPAEKGHLNPAHLPTAQGEIMAGEDRVLELYWPDDGPRSYLEPAGADLYRRVRLANREGYEVLLSPVRAGDTTNVEIQMTRMVLRSPRYEVETGMEVGRPAVVRTVCTTTVSLAPGNVTLVNWPPESAATAAVGDRPAAGLPGLVILFTQGGPVQAPEGTPGGDQGGGSGLVQRSTYGFRLVEPGGRRDIGGMGAGTPGAPEAVGQALAAPSGPPAREVATPGRTAVPTEAREAASEEASVEIECKLIDVPVLSPEWRALAVGSDLQVALEELVAQGAARAIAVPRMVARENQTSTVTFLVNHGGVAGEAGPEGASMAPPADAPLRLAVTPRIRLEGGLSLVLEAWMTELLDKVDGEGHAANPIGTQSANIRMVVPDGGTGVAGGLLRLSRGPGAQAGGRQPIETFIMVTPRVVGRRP